MLGGDAGQGILGDGVDHPVTVVRPGGDCQDHPVGPRVGELADSLHHVVGGAEQQVPVGQGSEVLPVGRAHRGDAAASGLLFLFFPLASWPGLRRGGTAVAGGPMRARSHGWPDDRGST